MKDYVFLKFREIFYEDFPLEQYQFIDETQFSEEELTVLNLCRKLTLGNISVSAENLFRNGGKEAFLLYVIVCNRSDKSVIDDEYTKKQKQRKRY